jgi:hypothetical protein
MQPQSGSLENIYQPHTGWALPLTDETRMLESLGDAETPVHFLRCEEKYCLSPERGLPTDFLRRLEYRSGTADLIRNRIANQGRDEYASEMLTELQAVWPDLVEAAPMEIHDDQKANCLLASFAYRIPDCWKPETNKRLRFDLVDAFIWRELGPLKGLDRQSDIYLGRPRKITSRAIMEMPRKWLGLVGIRRTKCQAYATRVSLISSAAP